MIKNITIIGSGNVATHLAMGFFENGIKIDSIYSRNKDHANTLANKVGSKGVNSILELSKNSDLYLICVSDNVIATMVDGLSYVMNQESIIAHTAGSIPTIVPKIKDIETGVFYPLQSFSKNKELDLKSIPILVTAGNQATEEKLMKLAKLVSNTCRFISDEERLQLHIAAVFSNNFTNHLFTVAENITREYHLDFNLLRPLILETASKVMKDLPSEVQTGPAKRNDLITVKKHIESLKDHPLYAALYSILSQSIKGYYTENPQIIPDKD